MIYTRQQQCAAAGNIMRVCYNSPSTPVRRAVKPGCIYRYVYIYIHNLCVD